MAENAAQKSFQQIVYEVLEGEVQDSRKTRFFRWCLIGMIGLNVLAFVLETVPSLAQRYGDWFDLVLYVSIVFFTVEYLLRIWSCTQHRSGLYSRPFMGRLRYMLSPMVLVDLMVLLPFYAALASGADLRFLRLVRLLWILKITRYLPAMGALARVLKRERRTLAAVLAVMLIMLFIASSLIYLLEHDLQPEKFGSIPEAMWWGMSTLTTVGYGDVVPVSVMGKVLGSVIMLLGIGTFALPAGVLASAFAEERKRQNFIVTWNLVAQVPLFSFLTAREIAGIAALLHPREAHAHEVIFRKGEDADSMFFIVSGELEAGLEPEPIRLARGDFFGEVALLFHRERTATVVALRHVELLELNAQDLHQLFERKPQLKARIFSAAEQRLARSESAASEAD
jgi:voltage-gated potassium channel